MIDNKYKEFAHFVAKLIFDENRELNWKADDELICRQLYKLGIVEEKDGNWIYISDDNLCESCIYGDTCSQSDKGISFAKHSKCWKYKKEADNEGS